jgi:hypothetical protein
MMKEREPNVEDDTMRAWLRKPEDEEWAGLGEDPTGPAINQKTEEIFESRTYRLRPTPDAYLLALDTVRARVGPHMAQMRTDELADLVIGIVEDTITKFLA